jgi:hypothetical protein
MSSSPWLPETPSSHVKCKHCCDGMQQTWTLLLYLVSSNKVVSTSVPVSWFAPAVKNLNASFICYVNELSSILCKILWCYHFCYDFIYFGYIGYTRTRTRICGVPEPADSGFLGLLSGNNSHYPNFWKPELPDPNFAGYPNAQSGLLISYFHVIWWFSSYATHGSS